MSLEWLRARARQNEARVRELLAASERPVPGSDAIEPVDFVTIWFVRVTTRIDLQAGVALRQSGRPRPTAEVIPFAATPRCRS
jgi:hypothetical protein